jgi:hypothetical protein
MKTMRHHLTMALASVPVLAIKADVTLIPLIVLAFLIGHGIITVSLEKYVKNFPSESMLHNLMVTHAAKSLLEIPLKVAKAQAVYLACDKGTREAWIILSSFFVGGKLMMALVELKR